MPKLLPAVIVLVVTSAEADTIYVDAANCPGPGDGSELGPYCSIQTAIDNAVDTDEIVVAAGTYFEPIDFQGKAIWLHSSDGPEVTTIDGTGNYHVVQCTNGEGPDSLLDGFSITGGNADGDVFPIDNAGGGMFIDNSNPTVTRCTFSGNSALFYGGGVFNNYGDATVSNCTFTENAALFGGGMFNDHSHSTVSDCTFIGNTAVTIFSVPGLGGAIHNTSSSPTLDNCTFIDNAAVGDGGAMYNSGSDPTVTGCTFSGNSAVSGGGMDNDQSNPAVIDCVFSGNAATGGGGGMDNNESSPTLTDCTFLKNTSDFSGGGMSNLSSSPTVINCAFMVNSATNNGGGMRNSSNSNPTVTNCSFSGNSAQEYGGMYNTHSSPTMVNCRFFENSASLGYGGAMGNAYSSPAVIGCTLSGNSAAFGGAMTNNFSTPMLTNCILWGNGSTEIEDFNSATTAQYSDVAGGWPGTGNIDADPQFVDPVNDDFRLQAGSPCIDAGHNWGVPVDTLDLDDDGDVGELIPIDFDGNPRFVADPVEPDTGCGIPAVVDMGAFEFQIGAPYDIRLGDVDGDGLVGINDFLGLLSAWGPCTPGTCCLSDLDLDRDVGILDFLALLANWGP